MTTKKERDSISVSRCQGFWETLNTTLLKVVMNTVGEAASGRINEVILIRSGGSVAHRFIS